MATTVTIDDPSRLSEHDAEALQALHSRYFANVRARTFRSDLVEKDWVIRLFDGNTLGTPSSARCTSTSSTIPSSILEPTA